MRKKISILVGLTVLLFVLTWRCSRSNQVRDLPEILKEGRITVMFDCDELAYVPDSIGTYGFQYELIKIFADSLDVELLIERKTKRSKAFKKLRKAKFDVLASLEPVQFNPCSDLVPLTTILSTRLMLVQLGDDNQTKVRKQYELDGDTIWVLKSSPYKDKLFVLAEEMAIEIHIKEYASDDFDDLLTMVKDKKARFTICPMYLTQKFSTKYPELDLSLPLSLTYDMSWFANAQSVLLIDRLNQFLSEFKETADFTHLLNKYQYQVE